MKPRTMAEAHSTLENLRHLRHKGRTFILTWSCALCHKTMPVETGKCLHCGKGERPEAQA